MSRDNFFFHLYRKHEKLTICELEIDWILIY